MSYLARLKALDERGQDPALPPFEAFEGWSKEGFPEPTTLKAKPFEAFDGHTRSRLLGQRHLRRPNSQRKGPLREPSKASKGPPDWQAGLNRLAEAPAPGGVSPWRWGDFVQRAVCFCDNWAEAALAHGWTAETLFGLHPAAPLLRFDAMGVAFLGTDAVVVSVEPEVIVFRAANGTTTRANPPTNPQAAAWLGPWMPKAEKATGSSASDKEAFTHAALPAGNEA